MKSTGSPFQFFNSLAWMALIFFNKGVSTIDFFLSADTHLFYGYPLRRRDRDERVVKLTNDLRGLDRDCVPMVLIHDIATTSFVRRAALYLLLLFRGRLVRELREARLPTSWITYILILRYLSGETPMADTLVPASGP